MQRIFKENKVSIKGKVFSDPDFKPFGKYYRDPKAPFEINPACKDAYISTAEKFLTTDIPHLPLSLFRLFDVNGNRVAFENVYFERRQMLDALTYAEAIERKGRFTEKLADVIFAILEESTWVLPAHMSHDPTFRRDGVPNIYGKNYTPHVDLFSAVTGATLAVAYYFHKDALDAISPTICERLSYEVEERLYNAYLLRREWWMGLTNDQEPNNWSTWITANVLTSILLMKNIPVYKAEMILEKALLVLDNYSATLPSDGGCDEGPSYWSAGPAAYFECLEIIFDLTCGKVDLFDNEFLKCMGEYIAKVHICANNYLNFADCQARVRHSGFMIGRFGARIGSKLLCDLSKYLNATNNEAFKLGEYNALAYSAYLSRASSNNKERSLNLKKDLSTVLPALKVFVYRESDECDKGLTLAVKGGHNNESHNHNDIGSFTAFDNGEQFIIDIGTAVYTKQTFDPNTRYGVWYIGSSYHNVAEIGGCSQSAGRQFASCNEEWSESDKVVKMELKNAYPAEAGIVSYERTAKLDNGAITITDDISLIDEKTVDFHFVTHHKPEILDGRVKITDSRSIYFEDGISASFDSVHTEDPKLLAAWKTDTIYRIKLTKKLKKDVTVFTIK